MGNIMDVLEFDDVLGLLAYCCYIPHMCSYSCCTNNTLYIHILQAKYIIDKYR